MEVDAAVELFVIVKGSIFLNNKITTMGRRRKITLDFKKIFELECGEEILEMLNEQEIFEGYDMTSIKISVLGDYDHTISKFDRVIGNLERYLAINSSKKDLPSYQRRMTKTKLAKELKVSRVTLDKWFEYAILMYQYNFDVKNSRYIDPYVILEQLKKKREKN